jgi:hypothetical protein
MALQDLSNGGLWNYLFELVWPEMKQERDNNNAKNNGYRSKYLEVRFSDFFAFFFCIIVSLGSIDINVLRLLPLVCPLASLSGLCHTTDGNDGPSAEDSPRGPRPGPLRASLSSVQVESSPNRCACDQRGLNAAFPAHLNQSIVCLSSCPFSHSVLRVWLEADSCQIRMSLEHMQFKINCDLNESVIQSNGTFFLEC